MEEGIHSMRVGGKRRVIMPQQLGYVVQGLGPYPADPRKRDVLVKVRCILHSKAAFNKHCCYKFMHTNISVSMGGFRLTQVKTPPGNRVSR